MVTLTENERLEDKSSRAILNFRDTLEKYLRGEINAEEYKACRLSLGIYTQRQQELSMVRTKIAAGVLTNESLPGLAEGADRYADGKIHLTTRQDIQFHFVKQEHIYPLLDLLRKSGIISLGAGGNTIRNVTVCDHGGLAVEETMNVFPTVKAVSTFFLGNEYSKGLPRKVKITFCSCPKACGGALVDDIAVIAAEAENNSTEGFRLYVGGGLGAMPRLAKPLEEFVSANEIHRHILAILKVFNKHGSRVNRNRARIKFLIEKLGFEKFRELYKQEFEKLKDMEPLDIEGEEATLAVANSWKKKVLIKIPTGDITSKQLGELHRLLENHDGVAIRATKGADLCASNIEPGQLAKFISGILSIGFKTEEEGESPGVISCNGALTCNEGITNSKALAAEIEKSINKTGNGLKLRIGVSGCPNSCGNHHTGDIGFQGSAKKVDGVLVPHYQLYLGGSILGKARFGVPIIKIPAKRVLEAIDRLHEIFREELKPGESVGRLVDRKGAEWFETELYSYTTLENFEENKDRYFDWGSTQEFSLEDVGPGECAGSALDIIDGFFNQARRYIAAAKGSENPKEIWDEAQNAVILSAKALLVTYGIDPETELDVYREFNNRIITRGFVPEFYRGAFPDPGKENILSLENARKHLALGEGFLEECLAAYTRMNAKANVEDEGHEKVLIERMDLSGVKCPFNYVKVKLALEGAESGTRLEILLDDGSPIRNVPKSLANDGHKIVSQELVNGQHLLVIEKG